MKKLFFVSVFLLTGFFSNAQELGLRFGEVTGGNVAIDGIFSLGEFSRVHADVSFGDGGMGVDALWDFMYRPLNVEGLSWYAGAGAYMFIADPFFFGVVGEIGLEYKFADAPISAGLDWRPALNLIDEVHLYGKGFGLNIRYVFGK
jgi:hypothetical protein